MGNILSDFWKLLYFSIILHLCFPWHHFCAAADAIADAITTAIIISAFSAVAIISSTNDTNIAVPTPPLQPERILRLLLHTLHVPIVNMQYHKGL